ncbi:MAG: hypothetical protein K6G83_05460 [Lachnospiraceae bacterium]|nr:hypothetical protein [Lachnospiraceae bacterium]
MGDEKKISDNLIVLDGEGNTEFTYRVSCNVRYSNGEIEFLECVLP